MSTETITRCDLCGTIIEPGQQSVSGEPYNGHIKYRLWAGKDGQQGAKLDLCADHAEAVWLFIQDMKWRKPNKQ